MNSWYLSKSLADERLAEVERRAERYSRLHPMDDDTALGTPRSVRHTHGWWGRRVRVAGM